MKRFPILVCLLLLLSSCTSELDQLLNLSRPEAPGAETVFYATTESSVAPETKTFADAQMRVLWNEGDQITIFNKITYGQGFTFDGEDGDTAGGFEPFTQLPSFGYWGDLDYVYAVYPYSTNNKSDYDGNLTVMLPSEQSYKENSFGIGANTMVAVSSTNRLPFKNVGGYLSFRLYGDGVRVSSVTIKGNNGEKIAGKAKVTIPLNGTPTTVMDNTATDAISIVCDPAVQLGADAEHYTDFWFVIPPVTFTNGFTITVTDDLGGVFERRTSSSLTINRNQLDWMNPLKVTPNYDNVYVPFEDANFKAYCVENFDENHDGEISISEAKKITKIDTFTDDIFSIKEIEFFENLEYLYCGGSFGHSSSGKWGEITEINVSKNKKLKKLHFGYCRVSSIDISNNTQLVSLWCLDNGLSSIDVSKNVHLRDLQCGQNPITELVLDNNTELQVLFCQYCQLNELDVSHNTALTTLHCRLNQLTALDVSNNTALNQLDCRNSTMEYLYMMAGQEIAQLSKNDITEIVYKGALPAAFPDENFKAYCMENFDADKNGLLSESECDAVTRIEICTDDIYSLKGIELFENLEELYCFGSIYTLENGSSGRLTSLDVTKNRKLKVLNCENNRLPVLDVSNNTLLETLIGKANQFEELSLDNNTMLVTLDLELNHLSTINLSHCPDLRRVAIPSNDLQSIDVTNLTALYDLDVRFNDLQSIDLSYNSVLNNASLDGNQIAELDLSGNENLKSLSCSGISWTIISMTAFYQSGSWETTYIESNLTELDLSHNTKLERLSCENLQLTSLDLSHNTSLTSLECSNNQLSLDVSNNTALKYLKCYNNQLTSLDVSHNTALTSLYCSGNQLNSLDVSHNTALTVLSCEYNQLTSLDVSHNTALTRLNCYRNQLTSLDVSNNTALKYLKCYNNQLTSLDVSHNTALTWLECQNNQLATLDVSHNTALTTLKCADNPYLTEIWLKTGQTIPTFTYDTSIATIYYKD